MFYVYFIKSLNFSNQKYIGCTDNLNERLETHNSGGSVHTSNLRPWELVIYVAFKGKKQAFEFEKYLKSGSGISFRNRHLVN